MTPEELNELSEEQTEEISKRQTFSFGVGR